MRYAIFLGVAIATATLAAPAGYASSERWCAIYNAGDGNGGVNCGFYTLQQCRDTISGAGGSCEFDYMYQAEQERKKQYAPKRRSKRH